MKVTTKVVDGESRTFQKTGMRCQECNHPFFHDLEVNIPIERYVKEMGSIKCPQCGSGKLYMGLSLSLSEDRAMRSSAVSVEDRYLDWLENGETGLSSKFVGDFMTTGKGEKAYPHDYDDLRRVILLLDRIPEWSPRMRELTSIEGWERIAPRWEEIVAAVLQADPEAKSPTSAAHLLAGIYR